MCRSTACSRKILENLLPHSINGGTFIRTSALIYAWTKVGSSFATVDHQVQKIFPISVVREETQKHLGCLGIASPDAQNDVIGRLLLSLATLPRQLRFTAAPSESRQPSPLVRIYPSTSKEDGWGQWGGSRRSWVHTHSWGRTL